MERHTDLRLQLRRDVWIAACLAEAMDTTSEPFALSPNCTTVTTVQSQSCGVPFMVPDPYTGKFDGFGEFKEPWRFTLNLAIGYQFTSATHRDRHPVEHHRSVLPAWLSLGMRRNVCLYSSLPSSFLQPTAARSTATNLGTAASPTRAAALPLRHVAEQQQHRVRGREVTLANLVPGQLEDVA